MLRVEEEIITKMFDTMQRRSELDSDRVDTRDIIRELINNKTRKNGARNTEREQRQTAELAFYVHLMWLYHRQTVAFCLHLMWQTGRSLPPH